MAFTFLQLILVRISLIYPKISAINSYLLLVSEFNSEINSDNEH